MPTSGAVRAGTAAACVRTNVAVSLGVATVEQVELDPGAEPGGADAEAGVAGGVGHLPPWAVPKKTLKRLHVSIAPPQRWVKRSPSSCGNVSKNCRASSSIVAARCS